MCLPKCPETGKSSYRGPHEALAWAALAPRRCGFRHARRAYRCPHCGRWHLTTAPRLTDRFTRHRALYGRTRRHLWSHDE